MVSFKSRRLANPSIAAVVSYRWTQMSLRFTMRAGSSCTVEVDEAYPLAVGDCLGSAKVGEYKLTLCLLRRVKGVLGRILRSAWVGDRGSLREDWSSAGYGTHKLILVVACDQLRPYSCSLHLQRSLSWKS